MASKGTANRLRMVAAQRRAERRPQTKRAPLWTYPLQWLKTEKFWQEVTTRTIAGLLVVGIGVILAVVGDWIPGPKAPLRILALVASVVCSFALYFNIRVILALRKDPNAIPGLPLQDKKRRTLIIILLIEIPAIIYFAVDFFLSTM